MLTNVPRPGSVAVRSAGPPEVPVDRCVDVRPGAFATFDGDRLRMSLGVSCEDETLHFDRSDLTDVEDAVVAFLRGEGTAAIRFGDRTTCREILPAASVEAIERRLAKAARRGRGTLVTWTDGELRGVDRRIYDAVVE